MRVLVASKFLHHVGGVETYIAWLAQHLPRRGSQVAYFGMTPPDGEKVMPELDGPIFLSPTRDYYGPLATKVRSAATSVYSRAAASAIEEALDSFRPDLVHFQSTCYQLTPSVVASVARRGIPMVTTAHEYKFVCSNQRLWDDLRGQPCVKCLDAGQTRRVGHILATRCVKGSVSSSVIAAAELPVSNAVWRRSPGLVHAPSRFMANLLEGRGSPVRGRVRYLDLSWGNAQRSSRHLDSARADVTYIGRLSVEKGIETLIRAWPRITERRPDVRLRLYGSGADEERLRRLAAGTPAIDFCGRYDRAHLPRILETAVATIHPSSWAENSPYTVRESLQHGVPAIVTDQGGLPEMVDARTGTVFRAGQAEDLANAIQSELDSPRAGSSDLVSAVADRFVNDDAHLDGLEGLYDEARRSPRTASEW